MTTELYLLERKGFTVGVFSSRQNAIEYANEKEEENPDEDYEGNYKVCRIGLDPIYDARNPNEKY